MRKYRLYKQSLKLEQREKSVDEVRVEECTVINCLILDWNLRTLKAFYRLSNKYICIPNVWPSCELNTQSLLVFSTKGEKWLDKFSTIRALKTHSSRRSHGVACARLAGRLRRAGNEDQDRAPQEQK